MQHDASKIPPTYHLVTFDQVRTHPKVCVDGRVTYVRHQVGDRDWHFTLENGQGQKLVVEIIPELPFPPARKGDRVRACGISRHDDRHGWDEVHPLTSPFQVGGK